VSFDLCVADAALQAAARMDAVAAAVEEKRMRCFVGEDRLAAAEAARQELAGGVEAALAEGELVNEQDSCEGNGRIPAGDARQAGVMAGAAAHRGAGALGNRESAARASGIETLFVASGVEDEVVDRHT
jgi:hypothetical protein